MGASLLPALTGYANNMNVGIGRFSILFQGNYTGTIKDVEGLNIVAREASGATVVFEPQTYTGSALTPPPTVTLYVPETGETLALVAGTDYTLSYALNVDADKASCGIAFKGNYIGSIASSFTIAPAPIADATATLDPSVYTYDGNAVTPQPTVTLGTGSAARTLAAGTDYAVSYSGNTDPGQASWTVTLEGNYTNAKPLTGTFTVTARREAELLDGTATGVAEAGDGLADALSTAESAYPDAKSIVIALDVAPAPADGAGALAIRALPAASGLTFAAFYDAVLTRDVDRTVTDIGSGNDALIGVSYPFDFSGRSVVRVFACHAGSAYGIAAAPNEYGEHVVLDRAAGTVTVYAKRYSTYGIGYTEASSPSASAATTRKAGPREGLCETRAATEPRESLRKAAIRQYERRAVRLMRGRSGALTA